MKRITAANRRLAKKRVKYLNEILCFVSSLVLADSLVLRNPLLRQAPKRYLQIWKFSLRAWGTKINFKFTASF